MADVLLNELSQLHRDFMHKFLIEDQHHLHIGARIVFACGVEHVEGITPSPRKIVERQSGERHGDKSWSDVGPRNALKYGESVFRLVEVPKFRALK